MGACDSSVLRLDNLGSRFQSYVSWKEGVFRRQAEEENSTKCKAEENQEKVSWRDQKDEKQKATEKCEEYKRLKKLNGGKIETGKARSTD